MNQRYQVHRKTASSRAMHVCRTHASIRADVEDVEVRRQLRGPDVNEADSVLSVAELPEGFRNRRRD